MRRFFIWMLIVVAIVAALVTAAEQGAGYVLIVYAGTSVELSLALALMLGGVFILGVYLLIKLFAAVFGVRRGMLGMALSYRRKRGLNRTTQGLIAFVEGRWDYARKSLSRAADNSSTPLINYLFAARASSALGDAKAVDRYLKSAEQSTTGAEIAIHLTQAELQIGHSQFEQALASLLRAKKIDSSHPIILKMLAQVYEALNDWQNLLSILTLLEKHKVINADEVRRSVVIASCCILQSSDDVVQSFKALPSKYRSLPEVAACYAKLLIEHNMLTKAEVEIRERLRHEFDNDLIELYGRAIGDQPVKQLAFAESLLKKQATNASLLLALGRISMASQLWGKARDYFEKSLSVEESCTAYAELGRLLDGMGETAKSMECFSKGLALMPNVLPALTAPVNTIQIASERPDKSKSSAFESMDELKEIDL